MNTKYYLWYCRGDGTEPYLAKTSDNINWYFIPSKADDYLYRPWLKDKWTEVRGWNVTSYTLKELTETEAFELLL